MATKKTVTTELQADVANLNVAALKQLQSAITKQLKVHEVAEAVRLKQLVEGNDAEYKRVCAELNVLEAEIADKIHEAKTRAVELIEIFQNRPESGDYYFSARIGEETYRSGEAYYSSY